MCFFGGLSAWKLIFLWGMCESAVNFLAVEHALDSDYVQ